MIQKILELVEQGKSDKEIALILNLGSKDKVRAIRRKNNIVTKKQMTEDELQTLIELSKQGLNHAQIAKILKKYSIGTIRNNCIKLNISLNYKSEQRYDYINPFDYSDIIEVLIGTLLGDCSLHKSTYTKGNSTTGSFTHSIKQKEYLFYKYNLMKVICNEPYSKIQKQSIIKDRLINPKEAFVCNIKSTPFLNDLYNNLYINKKKVINDYILQYFTEKSLAFMYFDDGYKQIFKERPNFYSYVICTDSFDEESLIKFKNFLFNTFEIESIITNENRIRIRSNSKEKFKIIIEKYIIPCMQYKL